MPGKSSKRQIAVVLLGSALAFLLLAGTANRSQPYMYHVTHGFAANYDWRKVEGTLEVPQPTLDLDSHKDYLVYFTDPFDGFAVGAGLWYAKDPTGQEYKCFLRMYADDNPNIDYHYVTCNPQPATSVAVSITQKTNDGKTWVGSSGGYTREHTFSTDGAMNPRYYGATSGSSSNNNSLYRGFSALKVTLWDGTVYDFNSSPALFKCWVQSNYKYDQTTNGNLNAFRTGPPVITVNECSIQDDSYRIYGAEWLI